MVFLVEKGCNIRGYEYVFDHTHEDKKSHYKRDLNPKSSTKRHREGSKEEAL